MNKSEMKKYYEYYNRLSTIKVNYNLKKKVGKVLKDKNIKWQDWLDDNFRSFLVDNGTYPTDLPKKIRIKKSLEID